MTDHERWRLRGPVRSCRLERTWNSRGSGAEPRGDATSLEFRSDGNLAARLQHNPDGSEWTSTYEYDDSGRLIQMRTESAAGIAVSFCDYDDAGRLLRVLARDEAGDRIVETYEYDSSGSTHKTIHVDAAGHGSGTQRAWGVEGTDSAYSAPNTATLTTTYNDRDQPTRLLFRDAAGRELSQVQFRYDDAGRLVEEVQMNSEAVLPPEMLAGANAAQLQTLRGFLGVGEGSIRRTHAYDEQGRRVETRSNTGPVGFDKQTLTLNDFGDPIVQVYEHEERDYGIDEEGRFSERPTREHASRTEARFQYEYDSHGNWISKKVENRSGSEGEFSISAAERRTITYFV